VIGVIVALLIIAGAVIGIIAITHDDKKSDTASGGSGSGEIFLEEASSRGTNPFGSLPGTAVSITTTTRASTTTRPATGTTPTATVSGDSRGLYGGSLNTQVCDPEGQIAFLQQNRSIADAFVGALNSDPTLRWSGGTRVTRDQLPSYIRELTPLILTQDTRVTNYGYSNGRSTPRQAVLQAGTAVMVDRYGVPRIKCNCGNPLTPPVAVSTTPTYTGPQWPGFDPTTIVVVNQTTVVINVFVTTNVNGPGYIDVTPGSNGTATAQTTTTTSPPVTSPTGQVLGRGDVQATLSWTGDCDLDLHVTDPSGTEIYYGNPTSTTGGQLDVDDIPVAGATGNHIENVFWPTGGAPRGSYSAFVRNLGGTVSSSCPYTLDIYVNGTRTAGNSGSLVDGQDAPTVAFTF
jgi:hypothetical protein